MGTDIHIYAEELKNGSWERIKTNLPDDRDYWSFAFMAGVRNGVGFAGCKTGEEIKPISEPRGIPEDTCIKDTEELDFNDPDFVWLGDHSFSWLMLSELIDLVERNPIINKEGLISPKVQETYTVGEPSVWCGWTNMPSYKRVHWKSRIRDLDLIPKIIEALKGYDTEKTRLVFGFDS